MGQGSQGPGSHWKRDLFLIAGAGGRASREEALFHPVIGKFHFAILVRSACEKSPRLGPNGHRVWGSSHQLIAPDPGSPVTLCSLLVSS